MSDWAAILIALIGSAASIMLAAATLWRVVFIESKQQELHQMVNSRLTQLLELTKQSAHAQGVLDGSGRPAPSVPPVTPPNATPPGG